MEKLENGADLSDLKSPYHSDVLITVLFALTENDWLAVAVIASEIARIIYNF